MITATPEAADFTARIVDDLQDLATLPEVTARIVATIDHPQSTPRDLYHIIEHDPSLVSRLLKLVNSSYYARATKIESVERAIILLGFDAIYGLAVAASMGKLFRNVRLCNDFTARDLWTHSVGVAVTARHLASKCHPELSDEAFLAGLMHDVGLLAALQAYPKKLAYICDLAVTDPRPFCQIERAVVGIDHQHLGSELANRWRFPFAVRAVVETHHEPDLAPAEFRTLSALVHVADHLCCQKDIGFNLTSNREPLCENLVASVVNEELVAETANALPGLVKGELAIFG